MDELIKREAAKSPRPFEGERLTGAISGQVEIEHYHRYLLAREFCRGLDVLDVASGEGYGTALLAQIARSAVGVEIDLKTVEAARAEFQKPNLRYEQGDARALPLPDACIDTVVSFETLEHLAEQDVFLSEIRRVMRPGGRLIVSTPDRDVYSQPGEPPNPFHVLELSKLEFETLLKRHFRYVSFAAQRAVIGSVIQSHVQSAPSRSYDRQNQSVIEGSDGLSRAPYIIAVASDVAQPPLPNSVYAYRGDLDTDPKVRFEAEKARIEAEKARIEAETARIAAETRITEIERGAEAERRAAEEQIANAKREAGIAIAEVESKRRAAEARVVEIHSESCAALSTAERNVQAAVSYQELTELQLLAVGQRLAAIETSTIWRATDPLRKVGRRFPALARIIRRGMKLVWWTVTLQLPQRYRMRRAQFLQAQSSQAAQSPRSPIPVIRVPSSNKPVVSVIIPTYGEVGVTLACLKSIASHPPRNSVEVLVVDDAYDGPEDVTVLGDVLGIQLSRNPVNLGFLKSCNKAARNAKGRYIYLLNNDTELQSDSIDALVDLLDARLDAGMAGSKLLFPDGRLQEAGGILWNDASGWNYGRGEDPSRPEYNYVREVDYSSGASIMIRRDLFESLGGFDEAFSPAYYEDTDLAFRIRERGLKVLYEPRSVVVHHEGMSHGTDVTAGVKAHQVTNQARMLERWRDTLAQENFANGENVLRARDRARQRKLILVVDHYVPEPDRDAGSRSTMGILDSLLDAGWVVKFWPHNRVYSNVYTTALERLGIEVLDRRWPGDFASWMNENGGELDHLLVARPNIAADVLPHLMQTTDAVLSYYGHDLHFERIRRQAELDKNPDLFRAAALAERLERRIWRHFDVVIYPSEAEAKVVRALSPGTLACGIVPFSFDAFPARVEPAKGRDILFVAGFAHPPNVDAATFFVHAVLPRLEQEVGPVRLTLAGSNPTPIVQALAGERVDVTGYVTDEELETLYDRHRASIVPLRFGAGVKGKVVEALSRGLPLVTTSIGAQGIDGLESVVPVYDDVAGTVSALKLLLTDDVAWMKQSRAQMDFAQRRFSRDAMRASVLSALEAGEAAVKRNAK